MLCGGRGVGDVDVAEVRERKLLLSWIVRVCLLRNF